MKEITDYELLSYYNDVIDRCRYSPNDYSEEEAEYEIFEEFDIGIISFFHKDNLIRLYERKLISESKMKLSEEIRKKVINMQNTGLWNVNSFYSDRQWKDLFILMQKLSIME